MQRTVLEKYLCCPLDHSFPLDVENASWEGEGLMSGDLRCRSCGNSYPVTNGIPNLIPPKEVQDAEVVAAKARESAARDADVPVYDNTVSGFQTLLEIDAILSALQIKPGDIIVDLGAGTGRLTVELAKRGAVVLAFDISPRSLETNKAKCAILADANVHHMVVDACYLPLRDGIAGKVGSGMMLEHIPTDAERRRCIGEIHRVLKTGGQAVLTVYNYSLSKRRRGVREGYHGKDLYYYRFDAAEMRRLLKQYRVRKITALLNLPERIRSQLLERVVMAIPPLAGLTGDLLFVVAERAPVGDAKPAF